MESHFFFRRLSGHSYFQRRNIFFLFFRSRRACHERVRHDSCGTGQFPRSTGHCLRRNSPRKRKDHSSGGVFFYKRHAAPSRSDRIFPLWVGPRSYGVLVGTSARPVYPCLLCDFSRPPSETDELAGITGRCMKYNFFLYLQIPYYGLK